MKKILLIRLSAIGDILFASPLAAAIKKSYPDAKLSWLVYEGLESLIAPNPSVDEIISIPKNRWRELWQKRELLLLFREIREFVDKLRGRDFDTALDVQGLLKSGIWAFLSGAKERIGLGSREFSSIFMTKVVPKGGQSELISSEYLYLAQTLGLDTTEFEMFAGYDEFSKNSALQKLPKEVLKDGYIVFCPFTTRAQKHWFEESWILLGKALQEEQKRVVLLGARADRQAADKMASSFECVNLAGETSLSQALAIIDAAKGIIGVDTGLTHAGIALKKPTVAIFGATRPYLSKPKDKYEVLYHKLECSPCKRRPTCHGKFKCMELITPTEVQAALKRVLQKAKA